MTSFPSSRNSSPTASRGWLTMSMQCRPFIIRRPDEPQPQNASTLRAPSLFLPTGVAAVRGDDRSRHERRFVRREVQDGFRDLGRVGKALEVLATGQLGQQIRSFLRW